MKPRSACCLMFAAVACLTAPLIAFHGEAQSAPPPAAPAPGVHLNHTGDTLGEARDVEMVFKSPMVPESMLGKPVPASGLLSISPPLEAMVIWQSSRSATLKPAGPLPLGGAYTLTIRNDLKDLAGAPVVPPPPAQVAGPSFAIEDHTPAWFSSRSASARTPEIRLFCNDEILPEDVAATAVFTDKTGRIVRASVSAVSAGGLGRNHPAYGRWNERHAAAEHEEEEGEEAAPAGQESPSFSVVKVTPATPLPPGDHWALTVPAGLPNRNRSSRTGKIYTVELCSIAEMAVTRINARPVIGGPRELDIYFSKPIASLKPEDWSRFIQVDPAPPGLVWSTSSESVSLKGNFEFGTVYRVRVAAGAPALDKTTMETTLDSEVSFPAHAPHLSLPSFDAVQWLEGRGRFNLVCANLASTSIYIKRIPADQAVDALRAYQVYQHDPAKKYDPELTRVPFSAISGDTVWKKLFPSTVALDQSERITFSWDEISGGKRVPGMYFISAEGLPKEEVIRRKLLGSQALMQLTDIGLAWKFAGNSALLYAFSLTTGQPLPGVDLQSFTGSNKPVEAQKTGPGGTARLSMENTRWLIARLGDDLHGIEFHEDMPELGLWSFDIPFSSNYPDEADREVLLFTDRPVYQPGETVYLKAIQRLQKAGELSIPPAGGTATLRAYDAQHRVFTEREVTFSASGTLTGTVQLPPGGVGWHELELLFKKTDPPADGDNSDLPRDVSGETRTSLSILVQEYQPNSFRIEFDPAAAAREGESFKLPLRAAYLMGKPLSEAKLSWTSRISPAGFSPEKWEKYEFCNARDGFAWDGDRLRRLGDRPESNSLLTGQGSLKLSGEGKAVIEAKIPAITGLPEPRNLTVETEITDVNQQTIAAGFTRTEHASEFYLGAKRGADLISAGEDVTVELAAVCPDGQRYGESVTATAIMERLTWNAVRVESAGGGSSVRHDPVFTKVSEQQVTFPPEGGSITFTPKAAGTHSITLTATDRRGAAVKTVISVNVFGSDDLSWQQNSGGKIDLSPDHESYSPGSTAKILVRTPLKGMALVTVERHQVLWQKWQHLEPGGVVEIPVTEDWSPNVFVSVMHLRGGAGDPREHQSPEYRTGFCQLHIESRRHLLDLSLVPSKPEYRPGEMVEVELSAKDSTGQPLPGTELAFWAVDQGILSLSPWQSPNPAGIFHQDRPLQVHTGLSLVNLMSENPENLNFTNKGFIIGGGGGEDTPSLAGMRKRFEPTPCWQGSLLTGPDGKVKVSFPAPDNLTEFRMIAVGNAGVSRFGTVEGTFKVNKPLMLEPSLPRFASAGDVITLKAVVHNTTSLPANVQVGLTLDTHTELLAGPGGAPVPGNTRTDALSLPPMGTGTALFTVRFTSDGPSVLHWTASGGSPEMSDAVESKLQIGIAEPLLREVRFLSLTAAANGKNLLGEISPEVLEGKGEVQITLSNTRALEGAEAVSQLLHYPYGCAEQTMSALIPWLTLRELKKVIPGLDRTDGEIALVIQKGVDRILSMQTPEGGLSYWPGMTEPSPWASAHGGLGLLLSMKAGARIPPERLKSLTGWLSKSLRTPVSGSNTYDLTNRAYAAWVLALAGKPEAAYHEALFGKRESMFPSGRAVLALAIADAGGPKEMALTLLNMPAGARDDWWLGGDCVPAMRAMALMKLKDPGADAEMGRLMAARSPRGDWRNTFNNAWAVLALGEEASAHGPVQAGPPCVITTGGTSQDISLPGQPASRILSFPRDAGAALPQLTATLNGDGKYFARIEVTGRGRSGPQPGRSGGFEVTRQWQKIAPDGTAGPAGSLKVGDLVRTTLTVTIPEAVDYLAIDAPLPATMEGVNPHFTSMASADRSATDGLRGYNHAEMRRDRALFFRDYFSGTGSFKVEYLARVVAAGDVMLPPARVEAMYDPARFGLSSSQRIVTGLAGDAE